MATPEKQKEYIRKHQKEKLDEIKIRPPKGTKERWRSKASAAGLSLQQYIIAAVDAFQPGGK